MDYRDAAQRIILLLVVVVESVLPERGERVLLLAVRKVPRRGLPGRLPPRLLLQHHEAHRPGQVLLRGSPLRGVVSEVVKACPMLGCENVLLGER